MKKVIIVTSLLFLNSFSFAAVKKSKKITKAPSTHITSNLSARYLKKYDNKTDLQTLKADTLALSGKAVPTLVDVMKNSKYPEKNRWMATFLLGRIMGKKSSPFIAKFSKHPSWVMRMASLKTLLILNEQKYGKVYAELLKDKSYIVRVQALDNIRTLNLTEHAPNVWAMLYDKQNYSVIKKPKIGKSKVKRTHIIKRVIKTVGDLKFKEAEPVLLSMIQKKKYKDIFAEMDYALSTISGKKSPKGNNKVKSIFWNRYRLSNQTI